MGGGPFSSSKDEKWDCKFSMLHIKIFRGKREAIPQARSSVTSITARDLRSALSSPVDFGAKPQKFFEFETYF